MNQSSRLPMSIIFLLKRKEKDMEAEGAHSFSSRPDRWRYTSFPHDDFSFHFPKDYSQKDIEVERDRHGKLM